MIFEDELKVIENTIQKINCYSHNIGFKDISFEHKKKLYENLRRKNLIIEIIMNKIISSLENEWKK